MKNLGSVEDLAAALKTTQMGIYCRHSRNPYSIPPVIRIPGDKRMWFDMDALEEWLEDPMAFMPPELRPKRDRGRPSKKKPVKKRA